MTTPNTQDKKEELPKGWKRHVREHGLIEWICPHGVGHPAPNEYQPDDMKDYPGHGCDGCCSVYHENVSALPDPAPEPEVSRQNELLLRENAVMREALTKIAARYPEGKGYRLSLQEISSDALRAIKATQSASLLPSDTQRLDWLQVHCRWHDPGNRVTITFPIETLTFVFLREAIDAAIAASRPVAPSVPEPNAAGALPLAKEKWTAEFRGGEQFLCPPTDDRSDCYRVDFPEDIAKRINSQLSEFIKPALDALNAIVGMENEFRLRETARRALAHYQPQEEKDPKPKKENLGIPDPPADNELNAGLNSLEKLLSEKVTEFDRESVNPKSELLPCQFCGKQPERIGVTTRTDDGGLYACYCATTGGRTIDEWNKRAATQSASLLPSDTQRLEEILAAARTALHSVAYTPVHNWNADVANLKSIATQALTQLDAAMKASRPSGVKEGVPEPGDVTT